MVVSVLTLAAAVRMGWPLVHFFNFDQARVSLMALNMARHGEFAALGIQSSTGIPNFPATIWLFALPFSLSTDPLVAALCVGLLGVLAVAGVWWLARRVWGAWAALSAALLLAASPFAVLYSRDIWSQDLLIPLSVLWAIAGVVGVSQRKAWAIALHVFLAGFGVQVHYAGIVLILPTVWLIVRFRVWRQWAAIGIGGALAALTAYPFISTMQCCAPTVLSDFQALLQQPGQTDLASVREWGQMAAGTDWGWLLAGKGWLDNHPLSSALSLGSIGLLALLGVGLIGLIGQTVIDWRRRRDDWRAALTALLPAWALAAPIVFLSHKTPVAAQYMLTALPALLSAGGSVAAFGASRRLGPIVVLAAIAVAAPNVIALTEGFDIAGRQATPDGINTLLAPARRVAQAVSDGHSIAVHTQGDIPEFFGDAAAFQVLLWDQPHQIVDGRNILLIPDLASTGSAHLLFTYPTIRAWSEAQAIGLRGEMREFPRRDGESPYIVLTLNAANLSAFQSIDPVRLANGVELRGWRVRLLPDRLRFVTWWHIAGPIAAADYHQFNHLRSDASVEPLQISDTVTASQAWQIGDTLIVWADFDVPTAPGPFFVDVGMYTYPAVERVPVLNQSGDPLAPIRLGPFSATP